MSTSLADKYVFDKALNAYKYKDSKNKINPVHKKMHRVSKKTTEFNKPLNVSTTNQDRCNFKIKDIPNKLKSGNFELCTDDLSKKLYYRQGNYILSTPKGTKIISEHDMLELIIKHKFKLEQSVKLSIHKYVPAGKRAGVAEWSINPLKESGRIKLSDEAKKLIKPCK